MNNHQALQRQTWVLDPPMDFSRPYALADYDDTRIRHIMFKYLDRGKNLARAWTRICHHFPETIQPDQPLSCLEFGTGHGAMLEIWRAFGHETLGTDFPWRANREVVLRPTRPWHHNALEAVTEISHGGALAEKVKGWAYQPIIESLGLDVRLMDGRDWPYPFEDKSFDIVCCYQAVDAFAEPEKWTEVVAEFCRIARRAVVVGYNPLPVYEADQPHRQDAARAAWLALSRFSAHGLATTFTEFGTTRRGLHPVAMKFLPSP
ncbi:MAG: class I SAM-dependent methyltransferase [Silicimonas sp.]|nr:class I SAM-dependent methyltransferase [Silicimonas sp.]